MSFSSRRLFFSLSTFLAAICAYFLAQALQLELPLWSFATVYIVAHPTSGMLRAKSLWRVIGTIVAALYTVLVLAKLPQASFALGVAISLWIGLCMYLMLATHAPHNYAFMLAGYTTVLIIFPSLTLHERLPHIAFTRTAEVLVGCLSAWIFSELFATRKAGNTALDLFNAWHADACTMVRQALSSDVLLSSADLARLSRQTAQFHGLLRHARYESLHSTLRLDNLFILEAEMSALAPIIHAISQRRAYLQHHHPEQLEKFQPLVEKLLNALDEGSLTAIEKMNDAILQADCEFAIAQPDLVDVRPYIRRMHLFTQAWLGVEVLRNKITKGNYDTAEKLPPARYIDTSSALRGALGALLTTWLSYELWRRSGWNEAALACMFGAMASSIFAAGQQGAARKTVDYLIWSTLGAGLAALYLYAILPQANAAWLLPLMLGIAYLPLGYLMEAPQWNVRLMPLAAVTAGQLAFLHGHAPSALGFAGAVLAQILGISLAAVLAWLLTSSKQNSLKLSYTKARQDLVSVLSHTTKNHTEYPARSLARIAWAAEIHADNEEALLHLSAYHRMLANVHLLERDLPPKSQVLITQAKNLLRDYFLQPHGSAVAADIIAQLRKISNTLLLDGNIDDHTAAVALAGIEIDLVIESWTAVK